MPCDFDTWNTHENFLSQNPRKASQERFLLEYSIFTCYWRQICYTQLRKPSPKLRSWAPLLVYDATVSHISAKIWSNCVCRGRFENVRTSRFQICPWFLKSTKICGIDRAKQNTTYFLPPLYYIWLNISPAELCLMILDWWNNKITTYIAKSTCQKSF